MNTALPDDWQSCKAAMSKGRRIAWRATKKAAYATLRSLLYRSPFHLPPGEDFPAGGLTAAQVQSILFALQQGSQGGGTTTQEEVGGGTASMMVTMMCMAEAPLTLCIPVRARAG